MVDSNVDANDLGKQALFKSETSVCAFCTCSSSSISSSISLEMPAADRHPWGLSTCQFRSMKHFWSFLPHFSVLRLFCGVRRWLWFGYVLAYLNPSSLYTPIRLIILGYYFVPTPISSPPQRRPPVPQKKKKNTKVTEPIGVFWENGNSLTVTQ